MTRRATQIRWPAWDAAHLPEPAHVPDPRSIGVGATQCAAGAFCREAVAYIGVQGLAWCEGHIPAGGRMTAEERRKIRARRGQPEPHNPRYCSCLACAEEREA